MDTSDDERELMLRQVAYWSGQLEGGRVVVFGPVADPDCGYGVAVVKAISFADGIGSLRMSRMARSALLAAVLTAACGASAEASTFSNSAPILVPACLEGDCSGQGPADPYPSTIGVSGLPGTVEKARVTLHQIFNNVPSEIDVLLVGPGGQKVLLLSDACAGTQFAPLAGQTFTFDDAGASVLPASGPCASGTYKPTNYDTADSFPPPAPGPPHNSTLSGFDGNPANGVWQLFVFDDGPSGEVNNPIADGWRLELLPSARCAGKAATVADLVGTAGDDVLAGTPSSDVMLGLGGNDVISGLGGNDVICGGPGKDKLKGQGGKDKLKGQGGLDTCVGGANADTAKACEKRKSI